jgi:hypothetical protein
MGDDPAGREAFAARLLLQLDARYRDVTAAHEAGRFALRLTAPGLDVSLPLAPLHNACLRDPERAGSRIAHWVSSVEQQLTAAPPAGFAPGGVLWCVRSRRYLAGIGRAEELLHHGVGDDMVAFVSETLPGSVMRGLPRSEWERRGMGADEVGAIATANSTARFARIAERVRRAERIPRDGWRVSGDALFQGSIVMVPPVLAAFAERAGSDVLMAVPDRSLVLAIPSAATGLRAFIHRVNRAYREAMTPCSTELLVTDGVQVRTAGSTARTARRGSRLLPWLRE